MDVIPLKSGVIFKHIFSDPPIFCQFVKDVLNIEPHIEKVHAEYEYPKPIGFVRSRYDLFAEDVENRIIVEVQHVKEGDFFDRFLYYQIISMAEQVGSYSEYEFGRTVYTIVVLTSVPEDGSVNFSCAVSDMNPIDEHGRTVDVYPHRLLFLCPRLVNDKTPPKIKKWLEFIADSFDGKMDEGIYPDPCFQQILPRIEDANIDPGVLADIKDEAAWENVKRKAHEAGEAEGVAQGVAQGVAMGRTEKQMEIARNLLATGLDIPTIVECTGLSEEAVLQLRDGKPAYALDLASRL